MSGVTGRGGIRCDATLRDDDCNSLANAAPAFHDIVLASEALRRLRAVRCPHGRPEGVT